MRRVENMANEAQAQTGTAAEGLNELSEFSDILKQTIKPRTDVAAKEVDNAVVALVREALDDQELVAEDVIDTLDAMLAKLDKKLTDQMNAVLHHEEFQKIESSWRGLAYTLNNAETDASLRVKVLNVSKSELQAMMRRYPDRSRRTGRDGRCRQSSQTGTGARHAAHYRRDDMVGIPSAYRKGSGADPALSAGQCGRARY